MLALLTVGSAVVVVLVVIAAVPLRVVQELEGDDATRLLPEPRRPPDEDVLHAPAGEVVDDEAADMSPSDFLADSEVAFCEDLEPSSDGVERVPRVDEPR